MTFRVFSWFHSISAPLAEAVEGRLVVASAIVTAATAFLGAGIADEKHGQRHADDDQCGDGLPIERHRWSGDGFQPQPNKRPSWNTSSEAT